MTTQAEDEAALKYARELLAHVTRLVRVHQEKVRKHLGTDSKSRGHT